MCGPQTRITAGKAFAITMGAALDPTALPIGLSGKRFVSSSGSLLWFSQHGSLAERTVHGAARAYTEGAVGATSARRPATCRTSFAAPGPRAMREDSDHPHVVRMTQEHGRQHDDQQHVKTSETGTMTLSGCTTGSAHLDRMTNAAGLAGHAGHLSF
jgi:hypothetical protein